MKLTETVLAIIGHTKDRKAKAIRTKIALAMNFTERWVWKSIDENKENGPLTTYAILQILKSDTGLSDNEILEGNAETINS